MRLSTIACAVALLASGTTLHAQDQTDDQPAAPLKLVMSSYQCDWNDAIPWLSEMDSLAKPIWQELVDEGKINAWGTLSHDFAGYENVLIWRVAPSLAAIEEAQGEFGRRFNERHADTGPMPAQIIATQSTRSAPARALREMDFRRLS